MDLKVSGRDKRRAFFAAIGVALMVWLVAAPVVEAQISRVRVAGGQLARVNLVRNVNQIRNQDVSAVRGTGAITQMPGSSGALAVRNYGGGGVLLGAGSCASAPPQNVSVSNAVVTAIIVTGTSGEVAIVSTALGPAIELAKFTVNANNPQVFVGLGNGLTVTTPLEFNASGTNCSFVLLGQPGT